MATNVPKNFIQIYLQMWDQLRSQEMDMKPPFNSLPSDNFFDWTKFKAVADDKLKVAKIIIPVSDREENMGKGKNTVYQYFLRFPQCFQKAFLSGSIKVGIVQ